MSSPPAVISSARDATGAFVERLRAAGHQARQLDIRHDDLGGPYDAVLANAVLLHLGRDQFRLALRRILQAVTPLACWP
jgi:hypothetical protein